MAKKKELKEVKELTKAPLLRLNENDDSLTIEPLTDVRPFVINFGKSWLKCSDVSAITEADPETGSERVVVTMSFIGQLKENNEVMELGELVISGNIEEE